MKKAPRIYSLTFTLAFFMLFRSCEKDEPVIIPVLSSLEPHSITNTTAVGGGRIVRDGSTTITAYGVCWGTSPSPTIMDNKTTDGNGIEEFTSYITGLTPNTIYYIRAYATNAAGTAYGSEKTFKTFAVMDIDGNGYYSTTIGNQVWLDENLKVTHYRNGDPIPNVTDNLQWYNLTSGAYCNLRNDTSVTDELGLLYNWYAIDDQRNLCPSGWHVATDAEWETLVTYLGGDKVAGGKMKEAGTFHWYSPNNEADNSSGFSGISGGQRGFEGEFYGPGVYGCFWTSTEENETNARDWFLYNGDAAITRYYDKKVDGFNVRCIKD